MSSNISFITNKTPSEFELNQPTSSQTNSERSRFKLYQASLPQIHSSPPSQLLKKTWEDLTNDSSADPKTTLEKNSISSPSFSQLIVSKRSLEEVVEDIKNLPQEDRKKVLSNTTKSKKPGSIEQINVRAELSTLIKNKLNQLAKNINDQNNIVSKRDEESTWGHLCSTQQRHYISDVLEGNISYNINFFNHFQDSVKDAVKNDLLPFFELLEKESKINKPRVLQTDYSKHDEKIKNLKKMADIAIETKNDKFKTILNKLTSQLQQAQPSDWKTTKPSSLIQKNIKDSMKDLFVLLFDLDNYPKWSMIEKKFEGIQNTSMISNENRWNMTFIGIIYTVVDLGEDNLKKFKEILRKSRNITFLSPDTGASVGKQFLLSNTEKLKKYIAELNQYIDGPTINPRIFLGNDPSPEVVTQRETFNTIAKNITLCHSENVTHAFHNLEKPNRIPSSQMIQLFSKTDTIITQKLWEKFARNTHIPQETSEKVKNFLRSSRK